MSKYSELFNDKRVGGEPEPAQVIEPEEQDGVCYGVSRGNRGGSALTIQHPAKAWESFMYAYLDVRHTFEPTRFVIEFASQSGAYQLLVKGRSLKVIYDRILAGRLVWIRAVDDGRDFGDDDEPVITSIDVVDLNADD